MSPKKKVPEPKTAKSGKIAVTQPGSVQPAAERKAAEAELNMLINKFTPTQLKLIGALRKSLRRRIPTAHEVVYEYRDCYVISFSPSGHGFEGVFALRGSEKAVRLYFNQGKDLLDPEKLLQGTSQTRYIEVEGPSTLSRPAVAKLMDVALAHNRVPFASEGGGSVTVRLTTAKKRQNR